MTQNTPDIDTDVENNDENIGNIGQTPLVIHKQYIKDLSFENPSAPAVFFAMKERPAMDMNIALDIQKLENEEHEHYFEVSLKINASAARQNNALFITDLTYSAAVSISGIDEKHHHPLLFVEVPQLIFPYARQIITNITQSGGFMPLQLAPVDFRAMYLKRFADKKGQTPENDEDAA